MFQDQQGDQRLRNDQAVIDKGMDCKDNLIPQHVIRKNQGNDIRKQGKGCQKDQKCVLQLFFSYVSDDKGTVHRHRAQLPGKEPEVEFAVKDIDETEPLLKDLHEDHKQPKAMKNTNQFFFFFVFQVKEKDRIEDYNEQQRKKMNSSKQLRRTRKGDAHTQIIDESKGYMKYSTGTPSSF